MNETVELFAEELDEDTLLTEELPEQSAAFNCAGSFGTAGTFSSSTKGTAGCFACAS